MMLVMGIPAIFAALVVKSRYFDENRYEFDPNKTWSVLEQGRGFTQPARRPTRRSSAEMERLAEERKNLVDNVKKLDEAMLALRAVGRDLGPRSPRRSPTSPAAGRGPPERRRRRPPAVDGLHRAAGRPGRRRRGRPRPPRPSPSTAPPAAAPLRAPAPPAGSGLTQGPGRRRAGRRPRAPAARIAAMLPLTDLPAGWTVGKSGDKHLETFNAENLFEKIDGRAESFIQYDVKGMAYTVLPPHRRRVERGPALHLRDGRPPQGAGQVRLGEARRGRRPCRSGRRATPSAGSTLFYAGQYYTQIVSTKDDPKFAAFALELAKRIAAKQKPERRPAPAAVAGRDSPPRRRPPRSRRRPRSPTSPCSRPGRARRRRSTWRRTSSATASCPTSSWPIIKEGDVTWQGFLRPYRDAEGGQGGLREIRRRGQAGRRRDQDDRGRGGRPDDRQLEHRPGRRHLPEGQRARRRQRRHRGEAAPRRSPGPSPRACPTTVPALDVEK